MLSIDRLVDVLLQDEARAFNIEARLFFRYLTNHNYVFTLFETYGGRPVAEATTVEDKIKLLFLAVRWRRDLTLTMKEQGDTYTAELEPVLTWTGASFDQSYLEEALEE